ncbi:MAG: dynamin family protein, partial [Oscillospiraceae bacterium]|nr:dynamin family protein [Oscillospiraceae bacterium]
MQLSANVNKLLTNVKNMLTAANEPEFAPLLTEIGDVQARLTEPLRVAVIGVMKAGKSTLMNALLKEKILYTNTLEATYTVSWFKYGDTPGLTVVFSDGSARDAPFSDLEKWTVRPMGEEKHRLDDVKHIIIRYPNEILKTMELIDTPGLESTTDKASKNTRDFLGQRLSEEADKITSENASQAEAIIYAFSRAVNGKDAEVLSAFKGENDNSSPINAIGLFTKADIYWNCAAAPEFDPLETVSEACGGYRSKLRDKLYTILPVVAK